MLRRLILFLSLLVLGPAATAQDPAIVLRETTMTTNGRTLRVSLLLFPGRDFRVRVIDNAGPGGAPRFPTLAEAMVATGGLAGCNGGFFEREPFAPVGFMVSGGQKVGRFDPASWMKGLLVVRDTGASLESTATFTDPPGITDALQSGPWLVRSGLAETDNSRTQLAKRTFICHDARGRWALGASERCTLAELAAALKSAEVTAILDIESALNLDGGPSTGLWLRQSSANFYLPERWPVRNFVVIVPASTP